MTKFLLDTNAVIAVLNDSQSRTAQTLRQNKPDDIALSSIVIHELFFGAYKSKRAEQNVSLIENMLFQVLEFDYEDAKAAAQIRASLSLAGTPIGPYDVLIAGQALSRNLTLITSNTKEFSRVADLLTENW